MILEEKDNNLFAGKYQVYISRNHLFFIDYLAVCTHCLALIVCIEWAFSTLHYLDSSAPILTILFRGRAADMAESLWVH